MILKRPSELPPFNLFMADSKELSPKSSAVISVDEVVARPYQYSPAEVEGFTVDPATSRHICRQYDLRIMPIIFCMYLFSALDRGNLGAYTVCFKAVLFNDLKGMPKRMA